MDYQLIHDAKVILSWLLAIINAGLVVRCMNDFYHAYRDDEFENLKTALYKVKNRIYAVIIAMTITSIVELIKRYY